MSSNIWNIFCCVQSLRRRATVSTKPERSGVEISATDADEDQKGDLQQSDRWSVQKDAVYDSSSGVYLGPKKKKAASGDNDSTDDADS
uniref:CHZ domain-containing protein n=1 Tax=Steinernema glaseri TaxID=37863 RepID=A0A1I7ZNA0_9BILA